MGLQEQLDQLPSHDILITSKRDYNRLTSFLLNHNFRWGDNDRYGYYARTPKDEDEVNAIRILSGIKQILVHNAGTHFNPAIPIETFFDNVKPPFPKLAIAHLSIE